jgi:hypothetical protein
MQKCLFLLISAFILLPFVAPGHTPFAAVKVGKSATAPRAGGCEFLRHSLFFEKFGHQKSHTVFEIFPV